MVMMMAEPGPMLVADSGVRSATGMVVDRSDHVVTLTLGRVSWVPAGTIVASAPRAGDTTSGAAGPGIEVSHPATRTEAKAGAVLP